MRVFKTGAFRDADETKLDFDACLSPLAIETFARYMRRHRKTGKGERPEDNWQRGMPLSSFRKSEHRHHVEFWKLARQFADLPPATALADEALCNAIEDAACGVYFNIQGYLHELAKARTAARKPKRCKVSP